MYGQVDQSDDRDPTNVAPTGRHRGRKPMPAPLTLGLTVTALLTAFGAGAALLPGSFTGSGSSAETPAGVIAGLVPDPGSADDRSAERTATAPAGKQQPSITGASTSPSTPVVAPSTKAAAKKPAPRPATKPNPKPKPQPKIKTPPTAPTPTAGRGQVGQENEVIRLTNVERAKKGCGEVKLNTKLRTAMRRHTQDMANNNYFSHHSQDGRSPWTRAKSAGYQTPIGENIAKGQSNAAAVMRSWMDSPGHKANILNCDAKAIGVGLSYDGSTPIWGQLFGSA